MIDRRSFIKASAILGSASLLSPALAQGNARVVRFTTGFLPGGSVDTTCRLLIDGVTKLSTGYSPIVETRSGAAGRLAVAAVKSSSPDGTNLLYTPGNVLSLLPHVFKTVEYDPFKDLVPVQSVYTFGFVFSVGPGVPQEVRTLPDYLRWAKANPSKAFFGSPATGASPHLLGMQLSKLTDTPLTHVGYKGGGPMMTQDILRGDVPAALQVTGDVLPHQAPDQIRTLASFGKERTPFLPNVPTIGELGYPQLANEDFGAVFAPSGTPQPIIDRWAQAIRQVVAQPSFKKGCETVAVLPNMNDAEQTARSLKEDHAFWAKVVNSTGFPLIE